MFGRVNSRKGLLPVAFVSLCYLRFLLPARAALFYGASQKNLVGKTSGERLSVRAIGTTLYSSGMIHTRADLSMSQLAGASN
jgi:hypothetical protein